MQDMLSEIGKINKKSYFKNIFNPIQRKNIFYSNQYFIGWSKRDNTELFINTSTSDRTLSVGAPGSGKSFRERGVIDRLKAENHCFILTDTKGEYVTQAPVQEKFANKLRPVEFPEATPFKSFVPYYLVKYNERQPENTTPFQFNLKDFELKDFITLFGLDENLSSDEEKCNIIRSIHSRIRSGSLVSMVEIVQYVKKTYNGKTRIFLLRCLKNIVSYGVIGDKYPVDFIKEVESNVPSIYLVNYRDMGVRYTQVYMSIIVRKLSKAKESQALKKKLFFWIDEAHQFIPQEGNPCSKDEILFWIKVGRQFGINFNVITQDIQDLDEKMFGLCRYIFIPWNLDPEAYKFILKQAQIWTREDSIYGYMNKIISRMKQREWMWIDRNTKKYYIIKVPAPLSYHNEET